MYLVETQVAQQYVYYFYKNKKMYEEKNLKGYVLIVFSFSVFDVELNTSDHEVNTGTYT